MISCGTLFQPSVNELHNTIRRVLGDIHSHHRDLRSAAVRANAATGNPAVQIVERSSCKLKVVQILSSHLSLLLISHPFIVVKFIQIFLVLSEH